MLLYILKLCLIMTLVCAMAVGSLWVIRRTQRGFADRRPATLVSVADAVPLGALGRLAVVEFAGQHLLLSVTRTAVSLVASAPAPAAGNGTAVTTND